MLNLAEELLLLALHDEKGRIVHAASTGLPYGIAGALLLELALRERVRLTQEKLTVLRPAPTGDPALDHALGTITASVEEKEPEQWVRRLGKDYEEIKRKLLSELIERGILREEERRFLWIIPYTRHPEEQGDPEDRVRRAVRKAALGERVPDERMVALLSLVHACKLTGEIFAKGEKEEAIARIEELVEEEHMGGAVSDIIKEMQAAVMTVVTVVAATSAATTAASC